MANTTRLGSNQLHILEALVRHGYWAPGHGWMWTNYSVTLKAMQRLEERGLAKNVGREPGSRKERYEPTEEAKSFIETRFTPHIPEEDRKTVVVMLAEHDLGWGPDMGWHLKNPAYTELVMKDLERDGLVICLDRQKKQYAAGGKLYDLAYDYGFDPANLDEI